MTILFKSAVFYLMLIAGEANFVYATEYGDSNPARQDFQIELQSDLLTLKAKNVPLQDVIRKIGELAGFKTIQLAAFTEPWLVSESFQNQSVREVVERLVNNTNRVIFYSPAKNEAQQSVISQVWLLGSSSLPGGVLSDDEKPIAFSSDLQHDDGKLRSEAALRLSRQATIGLLKEEDKGQVIDQLSRMLLEDQDPLVRSRAAIALGVLRDERAVLDLKAALQDQHSSVRSQTIVALGQIGGEQAIEALGTILLNKNAKITERIIAAQSLWKQDSKMAQNYLKAAAEDADEQVRLASSRPPKSSVFNRSTKRVRPGPEETQ